MQQAICNQTLSNLPINDTGFFGVQGFTGLSNPISGVESAITQIVPISGTFSNLWIEARDTVTSGTMSITLRKNGADTDLVVDITSGSTGNNTSDNVTVAAGDEISFKIDSAGNAMSSGFAYGLCFEGDVAKQSIYMNHLTGVLNGGSRQYNHFFGNWVWGSFEDQKRNAIPGDFTIKELHITLNTNPTEGNEFTFSVYKNNSNEASSEIVFTPDGDLTQSVTGLSIDLAQNDWIVLSMIISEGNLGSSRIAQVSLVVEADTDGESILGGSTDDNIFETPNYTYFVTANNGWEDTERLGIMCPADFTLSQFTIRNGSTPGFGQTFTHHPRIENADGNQVVTLTNFGTTGNDNVNTDDLTAGDMITGILFEQTGTRTVNSTWSCVQFIAPPVSGRRIFISTS